jgi:endonuclease/exonuclease/phosphatase family metal-dependent hydrolase
LFPLPIVRPVAAALVSWAAIFSCAALVSCAALCSCALVPDPRPADRVVIANWNVENLFDEVDDGDEYPEFDPGRGWTRAQFWGRCARLAPVIRTLGASGPDILVLEEVEGAHAAEVLNGRFLVDLGYRHVFLAPPEVPGVKTVILSRYPLVRTGLLYPFSGTDTELRPVVEAEFDLGGRRLVVLGNHWKSRIPTPQATEGLRLNAAVVLRHRLEELEVRADHPFVVALGDFNTSLELSRPWDRRSMVSGGSADADERGLIVFPGRAAAAESHRPGAVWDPWETVDDPPGTYYYHGDWNRLDHAFVTSASLRLGDWGVESFRVVAYAPKPLAFGPTEPDGVSDHFPVVLTLERRSP